ncbi:MAG: geranylgeranylglyceryl/heptaprenylglyceryl phosphate synthase [Candidatus Njordarchaeales archaeon]
MKCADRVKKYLCDLFEEEGFAHLSLIDPDPFKVDLEKLPKLVEALDKGGTSGFMVGGSTAFDRDFLDGVIDAIKSVSEKPVILFPGNIAGVSRKADAIFFLSPFNSTNAYYIIRAQAIAAPTIKKWGLETISLAYLLFEPGGTAAYVCEAQPIPRNKPEIAIAFATAAELFGFDMVYLEAGSGAPEPIPPKVVGAVARFVDIPVIVGGGIKTSEQAATMIAAGAKVVVQGTRYEEYLVKGEFDKIEGIIRRTIEAMKLAKQKG